MTLRIGDGNLQIFPHIVLPFLQCENHIHLPVHLLVAEALIMENQLLAILSFIRDLYSLQKKIRRTNIRNTM